VNKLEQLSMLAIDDQIEKDLLDAVVVAERMSIIAAEQAMPTDTIYFGHLGVNRMRLDHEKFESRIQSDSHLSKTQQNRILLNAEYTYEEYFIGPPIQN
jgi:hypothetical protein